MNEKQSTNTGDVSDIIRGINQYYQEITVTDVTGHCPYGHSKGETFRVTSMNHDCLCGAFYQAIHGLVQIQEYRGSLPWEQQPDMFHTVCPALLPCFSMTVCRRGFPVKSPSS